jgi:hypothetical protein
MINENDILKKILLNMKYDSSKTMNENINSLDENFINEDDYETRYKKLRQAQKDMDNAGYYAKGDYQKQIQDIGFENMRYDVTSKFIWDKYKNKNELPKESTENQLISVNSVVLNEKLYQNNFKLTPLDWTTNGAPYNEAKAVEYFGVQCMKLSGRYPTYSVGYSEEWDYYVSTSTNERCKPKKIKYVHNTDKNKVDLVLQNKLSKPITLKNGKSYGYTKFTYDADCKPIDYNVCLRYSWQTLFSLGVNNNSILKFKKENAQYKTNVTYVGCMTDNWFPWYNRFVGYIEDNKSRVTDSDSGLVNANKCFKSGVLQSDYSGVVTVENILRSKGIGTDSWDNPTKALTPKDMGLNLQEFNLKGNLGVDWNLLSNKNMNFYDTLEKDMYSKDSTGKYGIDDEWNTRTESYIQRVYEPKIDDFMKNEKFEDGLIWVINEKDQQSKDPNSNIDYLNNWFEDAWDRLVESFDYTYTKEGGKFSDSLFSKNVLDSFYKRKTHPATNYLWRAPMKMPKEIKTITFDNATVSELKKLKDINYNGVKKYGHTKKWGVTQETPTSESGELTYEEQIEAIKAMNRNMVNSIRQGFIIPSSNGINFKRFG